MKRILLISIFLLISLNVFSAIIYNFDRSETTTHGIYVKDFQITGNSPLKVEDSISVTFKLVNNSNSRRVLEDIVIFYQNPEGFQGETGKTGKKEILPGAELEIEIKIDLTEQGTWRFWPGYLLESWSTIVPPEAEIEVLETDEMIEGSELVSSLVSQITPEFLDVSGLKVFGITPVYTWDKVTVYYYIKNVGNEEIKVTNSAIFLMNPTGKTSRFGYSGQNTLKPGERVKVIGTTTLHTKGTWRFWPTYNYRGWKNLENVFAELSVDEAPKDTDGDGLTDEQENTGWVVTVYRMADGEIVRSYRATSNPARRDSDGDGLKDIQEFGRSDPMSKDTDGDGLVDSVDDNIVGVENQLPEIKSFEYIIEIKRPKSLFDIGGINVRIKIKAEDQGKASNVDNITVKVRDSEKTVQGGNYDQTHEFGWLLGATEGLIEGFEIEVWISDKNENTFYIKNKLHTLSSWLKEKVEIREEFSREKSYQLNLPGKYIGNKNLLAQNICLEIADYYSIENQNKNTVSKLSGDDDVTDGMTRDQVIRYLGAIEVLDEISQDLDFLTIKNEIEIEEDPILVLVNDWLGESKPKPLLLIGYIDSPERRVVIQENDEMVSRYPVMWEYLKNRIELVVSLEK